MYLMMLVGKFVDVLEKLCFQRKIRWIAQVNSPLLEIIEVSFFKIASDMLFKGGKLSLSIFHTFHYFSTLISRNSSVHVILLVI